MKADIFLSTRIKSTRLPGKSILKIKDKTITDHIIDRIKVAQRASEIILCTSTNPKDDPLVEIAKNNSISYFRGSEDDKLDRYLNAAKEFGTDFIVVVDGDDVFCEPSFIDMCISEFEKSNADYITVKDAPVGTVPFCIKVKALEKACRLKNETNTEIWGSCFTDSGLFKTSFLNVPKPSLRRPDIRLTLDYREDWMLIKKIFDALYQQGTIFTLEQIVEFLNKNPSLLEINRHAQEWFMHNQSIMPKVTLRKEM